MDQGLCRATEIVAQSGVTTYLTGGLPFERKPDPTRSGLGRLR